MKKLFIILSSLLILSFSICYAIEDNRSIANRAPDTELKYNGLFKLIADANKDPEISIKDNIYAIGANSICEAYFTLTQFVAPNLLVYTFTLPNRATCWEANKFEGYKIAFLISKEKFEAMRRSIKWKNKIGKARVGCYLSWENPQSVKVIRNETWELENGAVVKIPIIQFIE